MRGVDVSGDGEPVITLGVHTVFRTGCVRRGVGELAGRVSGEPPGDVRAPGVLPDEDVHGSAPAGLPLGDADDRDVHAVRPPVVEEAGEGGQVVFDRLDVEGAGARDDVPEKGIGPATGPHGRERRGDAGESAVDLDLHLAVGAVVGLAGVRRVRRHRQVPVLLATAARTGGVHLGDDALAVARGGEGVVVERQHAVRRLRRAPLVERERDLHVDDPGVRVVDDVPDEHLDVVAGAEGVAVARDVLLDGPLDAVGRGLRCGRTEDLDPADMQVPEPVELPSLDLAVHAEHDLAPAVAAALGRGVGAGVRGEVAELRFGEGDSAGRARGPGHGRRRGDRVVPVTAELRGDVGRSGLRGPRLGGLGGRRSEQGARQEGRSCEHGHDDPSLHGRVLRGVGRLPQ